MTRSETARRALRTYLRTILRSKGSADLQRFRTLLARVRKKRVTIEQAQALYARAKIGYEAQANVRTRLQRARRLEAGVCNRCEGVPLPGRTICAECNEQSKQRVYAKRAAAKAGT